MMFSTPLVKFVAAFLFMAGMVVYQSPVLAVMVNYDSNTGGGSGTGGSSDSNDGTCPTNPPVTATASISADGSSYSTSSATITKGNVIYLKASYTLNYALAEINGYTWSCENCNYFISEGTNYIAYASGQNETIKDVSGSFSSGTTISYKAGAVTDNNEYIKFTLSIDTTCVTQNGTAYDSVNMFINEEQTINVSVGGGGGDQNPDVTDTDADGYTENEGDCDDYDNQVYPAAAESCNGEDDDCDGVVDNSCTDDCSSPSNWYTDADGDGYGTSEGFVSACDQPEGHVSDNTDCNDSESSIHPGAEEVVDDGIDQDCDGSDVHTDIVIDDFSNEIDDDGDGYAEVNGDCDDTDSSIHPGAEEIVNDGIDQDCDGSDLGGNAATDSDSGGGCGCDLTGKRNYGNNSLPLVALALISLALLGRYRWNGTA